MAIAARMRDEAWFFALTALIQMTAEHGRATIHDVTDQLALLRRDRMVLQIVGCVSADDVRIVTASSDQTARVWILQAPDEATRQLDRLSSSV